MPNTLTWYTDMNIPVANTSSLAGVNSSLLWGIKAVLTGQVTGSNGVNGAAPSSSYWTCVSSSDGSSVAASDTWGSVYDSNKFIYGLNLSNYTGSFSWTILRSPSSIASSGYLYLLLMYAGGNEETQIGGFISNTPFNSGSATRRPISANEVSLAAYNATNNMSLYLGPYTSLGNYKYHICRTATGQFWLGMSKNQTSKFGRLIGVGATTETKASEGQPWYSFWWNENSTFNDSNFLALTYFNSYLTMASRTHNNAQDTELRILRPYTGTENRDGDSFDRTTTNLQGELDVFPAYVFYEGTTQATANTSVGFKGKLTDVVVSSYLLGSVYPASGDVEKVCLGGLWLPFDVAPSL